MIHAFHAAPCRVALCRLLAVAGIVAGPHAVAQTASTDRAADPRAAVPATRYTPASGWRAETPPPGTPDRNWHANNAAVAGGRTMPMPAMPAMATPAAPAAPAPVQAIPDQHRHHAGMTMPPAPAREQP